jgi:rare lipoprotein A (peptidoglycan hydrolase)
VSAPVVPNGSLLAVRPDVANPQHLDNALGEGIASWYGPRFQGRRTASGEKFDRYALTAAHKTLPLGSRVVVHNPRTGKRIVVRINDRGPYIRNRVLDLSEAAASALGLKARGHDWVVLRAAPPLDAPPGAMAQAIAPATRVHQPDTIARSIDDTAQAQAVSPPDAPNVAMLSTRLSATSIPDMATVPGTRPLSENGE